MLRHRPGRAGGARPLRGGGEDPGDQPAPRPRWRRWRRPGSPWSGGLGLWLEGADRDRVVCVTGTKGKSTTAAVAGHLLAGLGHRVPGGRQHRPSPLRPRRRRRLRLLGGRGLELPGHRPGLVAAGGGRHLAQPRPPRLARRHDETYYRDKLSLCTPARRPRSPWPTARARPAAGPPPPCSAPRCAGSAPATPSSAGLGRRPRPARAPQPAQRAASPGPCLDGPGRRPRRADAGGALAGAAPGLRRPGEPAAARRPRWTGWPSSTTACPPTCCPRWPRWTPSTGDRVALLVGGHDRGIDYGDRWPTALRARARRPDPGAHPAGQRAADPAPPWPRSPRRRGPGGPEVARRRRRGRRPPGPGSPGPGPTGSCSSRRRPRASGSSATTPSGRPPSPTPMARRRRRRRGGPSRVGQEHVGVEDVRRGRAPRLRAAKAASSAGLRLRDSHRRLAVPIPCSALMLPPICATRLAARRRRPARRRGRGRSG